MNKTEERVQIVISNMIKNPKFGIKKFNPNMYLSVEDREDGIIRLDLVLYHTIIASIDITRKFSIDGIRTFCLSLDTGGHDTPTTSRYISAVLTMFNFIPLFTCIRQRNLCLKSHGPIPTLLKATPFRKATIFAMQSSSSKGVFNLKSLNIDGVDYEV